MAEVIFLGTAAALADGSREPTMLALRGQTGAIVVDCGGNAVRQLQRLGVPLDSVERLILTHTHPDHTAGFPLLVEMLWLAQRRRPLPVHGPAGTLDLARRVFAQWDTSGWSGLFELQWHTVALDPSAPIVTTDDFRLTAAPGVHSVPVIGVRAEDRRGGGVLAYSADTEPCDSIRGLAHHADLLVHEATGPFAGHSSAEGAARVAREAGARRLALVHLAPQLEDLAAMQRRAAAEFRGPVHIGADLDRFEF